MVCKCTLLRFIKFILYHETDYLSVCDTVKVQYIVAVYICSLKLSFIDSVTELAQWTSSHYDCSKLPKQAHFEGSIINLNTLCLQNQQLE